MQPGTLVRLKSGTEGWVKGEVVDYYDVTYVPGGYIYGGGMTPGYHVRLLEGKHKGEVLKMPENYVQPISAAKEPPIEGNVARLLELAHKHHIDPTGTNDALLKKLKEAGIT
jgi:hypothetical protein